MPRIAPWDYYWHQYVNIESICIDSVHYLISAREAIGLVMAKLDAASGFHQAIMRQSEKREIQRAAKALTEAFETEMQEVQSWLARHPETKPTADWDPPNQPE